MFVDRVSIFCTAGKGGDGCLSFRREAHIPRGGPDGGDGGDGGDVVVRAESNVSSLANVTSRKHWRAGKGKHGEGALKTGRGGEDAVILVPPGTIVRDTERGHVLRDLTEAETQVVVARGGKGGKGNKRFASAINQAPRQFERGEEGEERAVTLELKLIADVGLIGKPNAGKSTLLSRVSRATPEIADYPFTTKYPNLGLVTVGFDHQFVIADIPGLIEGAHQGVGLGHEFLKHVERTRVLVHLVEPTPMDGTDPLDNYKNIREELRLHDPELAERPEIVCISKCELPDAETVAEFFEEELEIAPLLISAVTGANLDGLINTVLHQLQAAERVTET